MFCAARRFSLTTRPAVGVVATNAPSASVSTHGVMFDATTAPNTARSSGSVGTRSPSFSGTVTVTTRLAAPPRALATAFTSASVIVGSSFCTAAYSNAIPGAPSPLR